MPKKDRQDGDTLMKTIAIIPARGHSKGVHRKNLRNLGGKPLIAHAILTACEAVCIDRVFVSTDDPEIASVAKNFGAEIVMRPETISGDTASSEAALLHVVEHLETKAYFPDIIVFLQCTSPFTTSEDVDGTIAALVNSNADTALSVTDFHYFIWGKDTNGQAIGINHDKSVRLMRQEREDQFLENGAVYAMRTRGFKTATHRFFGKTVFYRMPVERSFEIDEPIDLKIAEIFFQEKQRNFLMSKLPKRIEALLLDFDGVMTDNRVWVGQDGTEYVVCSRSDGMGLAELKRLGLPVVVFSSEVNPVVTARCKKLGIECQGSLDQKLEAMRIWHKKNNISLENIIYIGNDINDLACMQAAGCGVAVKDAHPGVISAADIVLTKKGGFGAVRELSELIIEKLKVE